MWKTRTASEIAIRRLRAAHASRVDVAERPEQVAVVVVPRRDERRSARASRRTSRRRRAWTMCVCSRSGRSARTRASRPGGEARRDVEPAATRVHGTPRSSSAAWKRGASPPASSERTARRCPARAARAAARAVLLRAADALHLVMCRTFTGRGSPRRGASVSSPCARPRTARASARRRRPSARAQPGVVAQLVEPCRERLDVADRREEARSRRRRRPSRAAGVGRDDGHPGGERLDRDDRRALVPRREQERVEGAVPRARSSST